MSVWITVSEENTDTLKSGRGVLGYGLREEKTSVPFSSFDLSSLKEIIRSIEDELGQSSAASAEVTFGVQIRASGGITVCQGQNDANFTFKLSWKNPEKSSKA